MSSIQKQWGKYIVALLTILCLSFSLAQANPSLPSDALLLVTDNASHTEVEMHPIDATTLQDIPGYIPLSMGHYYLAALSPDYNTLAAILWPSGDLGGGVLHLINLTTWQDVATTVTFDDYVQWFAFNPDGNILYWVHSISIPEPTHYTKPIFRVFGCSVPCSTPALLATLPDDFTVQQTRLLKSGSQLALFGIPSEASGVVKDVPQVIVVDLDKRLITETIPLHGVKAGLFPLDPPLGDSNTIGQVSYEYYQPGLAWDMESNRLFVAHPIGDRYTVVDLAIGTAQEVALSSGKVTTRAKGGLPGMDRMAILNPKTHQLWVSSFQREASVTPNATFRTSMIPLGIQTIDTPEMEQVGQVNLPLFEMTLSPDSRYLMATGMETEIPGDGSEWKYTTSGLYIFDTTNPQTQKHFEMANDQISFLGFSPDSRYAYISSFDITAPSSGQITLRAIDLEDMGITAERTLPAGYSALLGTVNTMQ